MAATFDSLDQNTVRIHNIARAGEPRERRSILALSSRTALRSLLQIGQPGATRMGTLLDYIKGTETQEPITWEQAQSLAKQVDGQLEAATGDLARPGSLLSWKAAKATPGVMIAGIVCGLIAVGVGVFVIGKKSPRWMSNASSRCPQAAIPRPNGGSGRIERIPDLGERGHHRPIRRVHDAWQQLDEKERKKLTPPEMPEAKISVRPAILE